MSSPDPLLTSAVPPVVRDPQALSQAPSTAAPSAAPDGTPTSQAPRISRTLVSLLIWLAILLGGMVTILLGVRELRPWLATRRDRQQQVRLDKWIQQLRTGPGRIDRRQATQAIVARGPNAVLTALDALTTVQEKGLSTFKPANEALAEAGPQIMSLLVEQLAAESVDRRAAAGCVLREMGAAAEPAVPALIVGLSDKSLWVRGLACDTLGYIGLKAAPAVNALLAAMQSNEAFIRRRAIVTLGKIGAPAKTALPVLAAVCREDPRAEIARAAEAAMHQIDLPSMVERGLGRARPEIRDLVKKIDAADPFEAVTALKALGDKGADAQGAVPAIAQALTHKSKWIRDAAATALGKLGPDARVVVPMLQQALQDPEVEVREAAERALRVIGD